MVQKNTLVEQCLQLTACWEVGGGTSQLLFPSLILCIIRFGVLAFLIVCDSIALWLSPPFLNTLSVLGGHVDILFYEIYPSHLLITKLFFIL